MELKQIEIEECMESELLLIVPYGIETNYLKLILRARYSFNCTLWN